MNDIEHVFMRNIYLDATTNAFKACLAARGKSFESWAKTVPDLSEYVTEENLGDIRFYFDSSAYDNMLEYLKLSEADFIKEVNFHHLKLKYPQS